MYWFLLTALLLAGGAISYQDLRLRLISVWLIVVFSIINVLLCLSHHTYTTLLEQLAFCCAYLALLYLILLLYLYLKTGQFIRITDAYVGWGDVLIVPAIGLNLEPAMLIYFFSGAFIVSLFLSFFLIKKHSSIPLAGLLVLNYLAFLLGTSFADTNGF